MKFRDYFIKGRNYFITLIAITVLQSVASILSLYPKGMLDPIGLIKLLIAGYAGYNLKLKVKESMILGSLMFLVISWYTLIAMPASMLTLGLMTVLIIIITIVINALVYAGFTVIGRLIVKGKKA